MAWLITIILILLILKIVCYIFVFYLASKLVYNIKKPGRAVFFWAIVLIFGAAIIEYVFLVFNVYSIIFLYDGA